MTAAGPAPPGDPQHSGDSQPSGSRHNTGGDADAEAGPGVSDFGISLGATLAGQVPHHEHPHDPRFELASAIRRLNAATVGLNIDDVDINIAAASVSEIADNLERRAGPGRRKRSQPDPAGHPQEFFPTSPVIGFANPIAPPVVVEASEDGLVGRAWFDYPYEGPPTCVHGGVIALVFDEILGAANIVAGSPGMTGTLTIKYRKPTPLRTPIRLEARCVEIEGRKIRTRGAMYCEDELTAEADGIFIRLVPERFIQMVVRGVDPEEVMEQVRTDALHLGFAPPANIDRPHRRQASS
jgi:acyl-coenzyme A thioesterase PaaI-like protein